MNSTHIKEANVEQDLYYIGIAEKAYDIVVRFLSKNKNKIEGEGETGIVNKPFIPLTQWKGVALRGTDIDKNFPSLSEVVLFFIPTKSTSRGGQTIAGGFSNKNLKVGGIPFKGVLVNTNLIGPYNSKYMDTRLDKNTFIHEYIHFLDHLRYRDRGLAKTSAKYLDSDDIEGYYNTPEEFNAYYQEGQSQIVRIWKNLPNDFKQKHSKDFKAFQDWATDINFFDRDFLTHINKKYLKKFKKRLAGLYMYIQKGKLSEIISESKVKVDSNSVKKWAKDLRVLTKAYKQIGDNSEDPKTIQDFKKVRRAFGTFQENFEQWVYKFFLQYKHTGANGKKVETWEEKEVREKCWRAVTSLGGNFPEMWDFQTKKHRVSPQILAREREKNIRRYRAEFRLGIKALLQYIAIEGDQEREKPIEQAQIGPVKLVIHNFKRKGGTPQGEASREKSFKDLVNGIKGWSKKIQKAGFGKCIEGLTVDLDFGLTSDNSGDMVNGEYYMNKDMLKLYGCGMTQDTFTHELGHRFWYRNVPSNAKKHWQDTIKSKKVSIERKDVEDYVEKYFDNNGNKIYKRRVGLKIIDKKETNAEIKAKFKAMQMSSVWSAENKKEVVTKLADRWVGPGKEIPIEHITNYGNTNAEEAFAEAFKLYIVKGPGKLGEWTRWFFREIVRTGGANINEMKIQEVNMKYTKESLNEVAMNKDNVYEFIKFAKESLELKEKVNVKLLTQRDEHMTAACYNPSTNEISIYTKGRAFADVCRSLAHEMVHQKQNELGLLEEDSGNTGSDIENEANACAGILMRNFGKMVENLYD